MKKTNKFFQLTISFLLLVSMQVFGQYSNWWDGVPDEVKNSNQFQRFMHFYGPRTDETGNLPLDKFRAEMKEERLKTIIKNSKFSEIMGTSDLWNNIGPTAIDPDVSGSKDFIEHWGKMSGRVRGLAVHPTDPDIVYIGAAAGGIWKTIDGGATWSDVSGDLNLLTFGAIAIDPNNPNTVYAGSGESRYFNNQQTYEGDGMYKSIDGGVNWTKITAFGSATQFSDIEVSPHNSNYILAALGGGNWNYLTANGTNANEGVWRSTNGGTTWSEVFTSDDCFDVAFHPTEADTAYFARGGEDASSGFWYSADSGGTWTHGTTGLPSSSTIGRMQFSICTTTPSTIYALVYDPSPSSLPGGFYTGAFKSTDGGKDWSQIDGSTNIAGSYTGSSYNDQGSYDLCLAVSPTNADSVYFGNVEISMTSNGSAIDFVRDPAGPYLGLRGWDSPMHVDYHRIVYAPSNSNYIYVASDGGIHRSFDRGATWTSLNNGITTLQFYRVASHPSDADILYGGAQDNGNFSTTDKGATDWDFELTGDGMECFVDKSTPTTVFMSTQNGSAYRSTNSGSDWVYLGVDTLFTTSAAWTAPYWQDVNGADTIYIFSNRLWRSTDKGDSWSLVSGDITTTTDGVTTAVQSPVDGDNMIAVESRFKGSGGTHELKVSTDRGVTWIDRTSDVDATGISTGEDILKVQAHPTDANTFYLCTASYGSYQLLMTTDLGDNWADVSADLPKVPTNDIFVDPDNTNHIYVANDFGVYWSSNGGSSYAKLTNGMPFLPVVDFDFYDDGTKRFLRAASHGRGVYELNIDSPLPVELVSFQGMVQTESVLLNWETATETNNYGFDVERGLTDNEFEKIGFVIGNGTTNSPKSYSFTDSELPNVNVVWYRLKQIDNDGQYSYSKKINVDISTITGVEDEVKELKFELSQNYPNPFNPATQISYSLLEQSQVTITIVNALGQAVKTLINSELSAGTHKILFHAEDLSSGIYFYTIQAKPVNGGNTFIASKKMILLK